MDKKKETTGRYIILGLVFLLTAVSIAFIFPSAPKFKYDFQKGKPWSSDLLTAPFDFPIYKTDAELQQETSDRLKEFAPYYQVDTVTATANMLQFDSVYARSWASLGIDSLHEQNYSQYIQESFRAIYEEGVFSSVDVAKLKTSGISKISLIKNNMVIKVSVEALLTSQQQYQQIIKNTQHVPHINDEILRRLNLNNFISPNVSCDEATSKKIQDQMVQNISIVRGKVQRNQKIIDKGEVVNDETYNILNSLKKEYPAHMGNASQRMYALGGNFLIILFACGLIFFYLYSYHKEILFDLRRVIFILGNVIFAIVFARLSYNYEFIPVYSLPFIIFPIISQTVFDSRTAISIYMIVVILLACIIPMNSFNFILVEVFTGVVAVYSLRKLTRRSDLFVVSAVVFLGYSLSYLGVELTQERGFATIDWHPFIYFLINSTLLLFAYPLIFIYEKLFGFVSDVTLMELSDTNRSLLRKLSEEAPGTFQHCIQVSNLAQAAADAIDANPLLVRTGALYHDIGKLTNPIYFTENQGGLVSPHQSLSYVESAKLIIKHVADGVQMAEKHGIPNVIIDFIKTHHGTNKAMYFYTSFKNDFPNEPIDEAAFTYPGPMPHSKETAILMMADAIEATSRSLTEYTNENINNMVDRIIDGQLKAACFENTPITFKDISVVKEVFKEKLKTMYHTRVQYPTAK